MATSLTDKVVIITGASSGIGAAAAEAFVQAGARVVLAAPSAERLNPVAEKLSATTVRYVYSSAEQMNALSEKLGGPERALAVTTDVTRVEDCNRLAQLTAQQFGRIDVLVNNAGIGQWAKFEELTEAETRRLVEVNILGVVNATHAVLPWMRRQRNGVLINVASMVAHMGIPMMSVYCATKFAVRGLSQALRLELTGDGIEVVCFCPGHTSSKFFDRSIVRVAQWRHGLSKPMSPVEVARRLVAVTIRPTPEVVLTAEGRVMAFATRYFPRLAAWGAKLFFHWGGESAAGLTRPRWWNWRKND